MTRRPETPRPRTYTLADPETQQDAFAGCLLAVGIAALMLLGAVFWIASY